MNEKTYMREKEMTSMKGTVGGFREDK